MVVLSLDSYFTKMCIPSFEVLKLKGYRIRGQYNLL
jgi:hypothetical protein